jgi:hypothetical protein
MGDSASCQICVAEEVLTYGWQGAKGKQAEGDDNPESPQGHTLGDPVSSLLKVTL